MACEKRGLGVRVRVRTSRLVRREGRRRREKNLFLPDGESFKSCSSQLTKSLVASYRELEVPCLLPGKRESGSGYFKV